MIRKIKNLLIPVLLAGSLLAPLAAVPVGAVTVFDKACTGSDTAVCKAKADDAKKAVAPIVSILLFLVGAIAVIVIIIGGILYVVSTGEPAKTKRAKDTILYAAVGLVIALLAYAIVNFVVSRF